MDKNIRPLSRDFLLKQGQCCGSKCQNCPYSPKWTRGANSFDGVNNDRTEVAKPPASTFKKYYPLFLIFLLGCSSQKSLEKQPVSIQRQLTWYNQKCEMCGREFTTASIHNDVLPPTIEWCFYDGKICEQGLEIVIDGLKAEAAGDDDLVKKEKYHLYLHCTECVGCRCAHYRPREWKQLHANSLPE